MQFKFQLLPNGHQSSSSLAHKGIPAVANAVAKKICIELLLEGRETDHLHQTYSQLFCRQGTTTDEHQSPCRLLSLRNMTFSFNNYSTICG